MDESELQTEYERYRKMKRRDLRDLAAQGDEVAQNILSEGMRKLAEVVVAGSSQTLLSIFAELAVRIAQPQKDVIISHIPVFTATSLIPESLFTGLRDYAQLSVTKTMSQISAVINDAFWYLDAENPDIEIVTTSIVRDKRTGRRYKQSVLIRDKEEWMNILDAGEEIPRNRGGRPVGGLFAVKVVFVDTLRIAIQAARKRRRRPTQWQVAAEMGLSERMLQYYIQMHELGTWTEIMRVF